MTPAELATIEALANAATPGPWVVEHWDDQGRIHRSGSVDTVASNGGTGDWDDVDGPNAAFIAAARTAVPELIAALRDVAARHARVHDEADKYQTRALDAEAEVKRLQARSQSAALMQVDAALATLARARDSAGGPLSSSDYEEFIANIRASREPAR